MRAVQAVATASAAVGARRLVAVTSAMVLGAEPGQPGAADDDAAVAAAPDAGVVGDLLEVERILARTPRVHPGLAVTVLRPAALVGPEVDTVVTRHFEAPRLLKVKESENAWQFCHFDDLATAVVTALVKELDGAADGRLGRRPGPGAARAADRHAPDRAAGGAGARHGAAAAPGRRAADAGE